MNYRNQHIVVVGAGQSGRALVRFLVARGAEVTLSDRRTAEQLGELADLSGLPVRYDFGGHDMALFEQADLIAISPGVPLDAAPLQRALGRNIPVLGEIELASREVSSPVIAVTGTNGKSTTTCLIGEALAAAGQRVFVGGNLGTPLIDAVGRGDEVLVVELSSFQLETIERFRPHVAVLLNLSPDHLDRYPDLASYYRAKLNIFRNMTATGFAVLNADDETIVALSPGGGAQKVWFSPRGQEVEGLIREGDHLLWTWQGARESYPLAELFLAGEHNVENAMAALAAALLQGCPGRVAWPAICRFKGLRHRMQLVRTRAGVRWYNDSKGTNVGSVLKSLAGLAWPVTLIAGGKDKGGDYAPLREALHGTVGHLILIGEARQRMREAFAGSCEISTADSLAAAVALAAQLTPSGGTVLLSPACSSFDMFDSYEHRGSVFEELVRALPEIGGER
ncbi:MAG: UDP-N-acetylmuramoyl-L-alanine--D-glutamate ligase [Pelovirga sp.]